MAGYELRNVMASLDTSGDGMLDMDEFKKVSARASEGVYVRVKVML